jgi:flagellar assembly factor FliW
MKIETTRFGSLTLDPQAVLLFPAGIPGLESCRQWVLLADAENDALGWLQSTLRPEIALAVVNPRRFVEGYQARVARSELAPLGLDGLQEAQVFAIVGKGESGITLNLKAPLVINLRRRLGRQVVANGDQPIRHELPAASRTARAAAQLKTA